MLSREEKVTPADHRCDTRQATDLEFVVMTVTFLGVELLTMRVTRFTEHQLSVFLRSRACSCVSGRVPGTE
jgi:hypothetical protein